MVILGTKWPSITSTWSRVAPPRTAALASSARRAKSADKMDGAISIKASPRVLLSLGILARAAKTQGEPQEGVAHDNIPL